MRQDVGRHEPDVVLGEVVRHRAELHDRQEVPHAEAARDRLELLAHRRRAADDREPALDHVARAERLQVRRRRGEHRLERTELARVLHVARRREVGRREVQELLVEVLQVRAVQGLGLLVGVGHGDELQERGAVRVAVAAVGVGAGPEAVHGRLGRARAEVAQERVRPVALVAHVPRRRAVRPWHEQRRVRRLHRPRPQVHAAQLVVLAVPREDLGIGPGAQHELDPLPPARALHDRRHPVAHPGVGADAHRDAGDEPPVAQAVQDRVLLRDARRRRRRGQRRAELDERDVQAALAREAGEDRPEQVRVAHEAVGVLVVLVRPQPVEAELRGEHELVDRLVEEVARLAGVAELGPRGVDPHRPVARLDVVGQIPVRHEVERRDLHPVASHPVRIP